MSNMKRLLANMMLSITIISSVSSIAYAEEDIPSNTSQQEVSIVDICNEQSIDEKIIDVPSLDVQLAELYEKVGEKVNIKPSYVKMLHLLAGGKAVYADKRPNIYTDITVENIKGAFEIDGVDTVIRQFDDVMCADYTISRPSKYYLPDAAYSLALDIAHLMNQRVQCDRGGIQIYYDALKEDVKMDIVFTEAVLLYIGETEDNVDNFYKSYEKMMFDKSRNENVIDTIGCANAAEAVEKGMELPECIKIKDKFKTTLIENGLGSERTLKALAIILSFDGNLAINDNVEVLKDEYVLPYKVNYTSRENMMIAAMSLVGKVRYVWGGGHSGASNIDGINPAWIEFEDIYQDYPYNEIVDSETGEVIQIPNESFGKCIKPSGSWCPNHGASNTECSLGRNDIHSVDDYLNNMRGYIDMYNLDNDKYRELMKNIDYTGGISVDTLNGLDCSGYASWVYNQVTDRYSINYLADDFTKSQGVEHIEFGSELLPGDVFAWNSHIVVIIGKLRDECKVYVTSEATPNVIRFGVVYYIGASQSDIEAAKQVALEANQLIGGINEYEPPKAYCMDTVGKYTEYHDNLGNIVTESEYNELPDTLPEPSVEDIDDIEEESGNATGDGDGSSMRGESSGAGGYIALSEDIPSMDSSELRCKGDKVSKESHSIGRLRDSFIDEDTIIPDYNKPIKDMCASDIIQYVLCKLPISYVTGYNEYAGMIFDKSLVASSLGVADEQKEQEENKEEQG